MIKNVMAAVAVASILGLGACATGSVSPIDNVMKLECKADSSLTIASILHEQQVKFPAYMVHIENVVTGDPVQNLLAGTDIKADTVVVFGATVDNAPSTGVKVYAVNNGCVVGQKMMAREDAVAQGLLAK